MEVVESSDSEYTPGTCAESHLQDKYNKEYSEDFLSSVMEKTTINPPVDLGENSVSPNEGPIGSEAPATNVAPAVTSSLSTSTGIEQPIGSVSELLQVAESTHTNPSDKQMPDNTVEAPSQLNGPADSDESLAEVHKEPIDQTAVGKLGKIIEPFQ